jgi:hypothetical protein
MVNKPTSAATPHRARSAAAACFRGRVADIGSSLGRGRRSDGAPSMVSACRTSRATTAGTLLGGTSAAVASARTALGGKRCEVQLGARSHRLNDRVREQVDQLRLGGVQLEGRVHQPVRLCAATPGAVIADLGVREPAAGSECNGAGRAPRRCLLAHSVYIAGWYRAEGGQSREASAADVELSFRASRMRRSAAGSAGAQQARPRVRRELNAARTATTATKPARTIHAVMSTSSAVCG